MRKPRWYVVIGPERTWVDDILGYGQGPRYNEHDVFYVYTMTAKRAKWAAFRRAMTNGDAWYTDLMTEHPMSGVRALDTTQFPEEEFTDTELTFTTKYVLKELTVKEMVGE